MSEYFEWVLALRLAPDTPESLLDELRYYLGLSPEPPDEPTLEYDLWDEPGQGLAANPVSSLPGGEFASLVEQRPYLDLPPAWGLFIRRLFLDDDLGLAVDALHWLAPWSLTQGWVGFLRKEFDLRPCDNFYVQNGCVYVSRDAASIEPLYLNRDAPPFTLKHTGEDYGRLRRASGETAM